MKTSQTFIIIGNGVAAWRINAELERKFVDAKILRIGSESFAPSCSFRSTAINCLRGTEKGISPLGDLIVDSHHEFLNFMANNRPIGVHPSFEWQIWDGDNEMSASKWLRRYKNAQEFKSVQNIQLNKSYQGAINEAYLIDPNAFYKWHESQFKNTEVLEDFVAEINCEKKGHTIKTQNGLTLFGDKVFLCAGHCAPVFSEVITEPECLNYLHRSKPVKGAYLRTRSANFSHTFSLAIEDKHLICRDGELMIGSVSENGSRTMYQKEGPLRETYEFVASHLREPGLLPRFEEMEIVVGSRHKGPKRTPWWGGCGQNLYGVFGLYKNGFSFSFKAAKDLVASIN